MADLGLIESTILRLPFIEHPWSSIRPVLPQNRNDQPFRGPGLYPSPFSFHHSRRKFRGAGLCGHDFLRTPATFTRERSRRRAANAILITRTTLLSHHWEAASVLRCPIDKAVAKVAARTPSARAIAIGARIAKNVSASNWSEFSSDVEFPRRPSSI